MKKTIKRRNTRRRRGTQKGNGFKGGYHPKFFNDYAKKVHPQHKRKSHSIGTFRDTMPDLRLNSVAKTKHLHKHTPYVGMNLGNLFKKNKVHPVNDSL